MPWHWVPSQAGAQQEQPQNHEISLLTYSTELRTQETPGSVTPLVSDPAQAASPLFAVFFGHSKYDSEL